jgi:hypothetical protein
MVLSLLARIPGEECYAQQPGPTRVPAFGADEHQHRTEEHGDADCLTEQGRAQRLPQAEGKEDSSQAPTKDSNDMPASPEDAHMAFADDATTIRRDETALTHTLKDQDFSEDRVRKPDEEREEGRSNQSSVHALVRS